MGPITLSSTDTKVMIPFIKEFTTWQGVKLVNNSNSMINIIISIEYYGSTEIMLKGVLKND